MQRIHLLYRRDIAISYVSINEHFAICDDNPLEFLAGLANATVTTSDYLL